MALHSLGDATCIALGRIPARRAPARSGAPHPTGAPVRRDSIEAGTFEDLFFAVPGKGETDRLVRMARAALDSARRLKRIERAGERSLSVAERRLTRLSAGAVRLYEELCTLARLNRGRVFPSYDWLAEATGLGRATIARSLTVLEALGFLVRQRRFRRVEGAGAGPRYAQTSNAYRPIVPARIIGLLPRWLRPAPLPADVVAAEGQRLAETRSMLNGQSAAECTDPRVGGALGRMLARLGAAIDARDQRESHDGPQPLPDSFRKNGNGVGLVGRP
ncbi:helix-turn-helix domain-containing protein [Sphingomonas sp.]|uniref:helix-turn-helix domain-containing protein n=1 Tax=Sphingomonas sp. TaxID=28214 RepID=UPI002CC7BC7D|nr:helix-turn-helix domain-containing protein [Sphingomonas sp.]HTG38033.1 helix-turn-helix domain-containing protein [Sphingomonas sp.]